MRIFEFAPLPFAAVSLAVLATCCPAAPGLKNSATPVQPAGPATTAPVAAPVPPPPPPAGPPVARTVDVVDHQFGLTVPDPYRWMEGIGNTEYTTWLADAICHARGGGEKGRKWQDDGSREHKLNGIADVIACGEYLVAHHYTTPQHQAIEGGSAGGILMGRTLDERPDLFAAVHIAVGMVNPLRTLAAENGANQIGELGDPSTEAGYKSILAYDPYLNVKPSTAYPAVLFTIGLNDHRVAPWMTGKMAARLRATTTSTHPILVRVEDDAGHGIGSTRDQGFAETADVWAFLLHQFGL